MAEKNLSLPISCRLFESCSWISGDQLGWLCSWAMCVTDVSPLGSHSPNGPFLSQNKVAKSRAPDLWWKSALYGKNQRYSCLNKIDGETRPAEDADIKPSRHCGLSSWEQCLLFSWARRFLPDVFSGFKLAGRVFCFLYIDSCYFLASAVKVLQSWVGWCLWNSLGCSVSGFKTELLFVSWMC